MSGGGWTRVFGLIQKKIYVFEAIQGAHPMGVATYGQGDFSHF